MDDRSISGGLEGADPAAAGTGPAPEAAPPGATVEDAEHLVPGATHDGPAVGDAKPWSTSLAYDSEQAGVANDPAADAAARDPLQDDDAR